MAPPGRQLRKHGQEKWHTIAWGPTRRLLAATTQGSLLQFVSLFVLHGQSGGYYLDKFRPHDKDLGAGTGRELHQL